MTLCFGDTDKMYLRYQKYLIAEKCPPVSVCSILRSMSQSQNPSATKSEEPLRTTALGLPV